MSNLGDRLYRLFSWKNPSRPNYDENNIDLDGNEHLSRLRRTHATSSNRTTSNAHNRRHESNVDDDLSTENCSSSTQSSVLIELSTGINSSSSANSTERQTARLSAANATSAATSPSTTDINNNTTITTNLMSASLPQSSPIRTGSSSSSTIRHNRRSSARSRPSRLIRSILNNIANRRQFRSQTAPSRGTNQSPASANSPNPFIIFSQANKKNERNLLSACCAILSIAILAVSLIEVRWFYLNGGGCNVNYIGVAHFIAPGRLDSRLEMSKVTKSDMVVYTFVLSNGFELKNCANHEILLIMRVVTAFIFIAIFSCFIGLVLDIFGSMRSGLKLVRRHAIFYILTVMFCLAINGFCFWISERMNELQNETRAKKGKKVEVSFDLSYYLVVLASGLCVLASAFTLIRRYPSDEDDSLERIFEEYTDLDDPLHMERSLPSTQPLLELAYLNGTDDEQTRHLLSQRGSYLLPPPAPAPAPPSTPPPSLHPTAYNNVEPPPPYDPTPAIA